MKGRWSGTGAAETSLPALTGNHHGPAQKGSGPGASPKDHGGKTSVNTLSTSSFQQGGGGAATGEQKDKTVSSCSLSVSNDKITAVHEVIFLPWPLVAASQNPDHPSGSHRLAPPTSSPAPAQLHSELPCAGLSSWKGGTTSCLLAPCPSPHTSRSALDRAEPQADAQKCLLREFPGGLAG